MGKLGSNVGEAFLPRHGEGNAPKKAELSEGRSPKAERSRPQGKGKGLSVMEVKCRIAKRKGERA